MDTKNLHNAYAYEPERRAAAESWRQHELGSKRQSQVPSPVFVTGIVAVLIVLLRAL